MSRPSSPPLVRCVVVLVLVKLVVVCVVQLDLWFGGCSARLKSNNKKAKSIELVFFFFFFFFLVFVVCVLCFLRLGLPRVSSSQPDYGFCPLIFIH